MRKVTGLGKTLIELTKKWKMNEISTPKGEIVFDWQFQIHVAGKWNGRGHSGGGTLYKCRNTGAIKEVVFGKNGKTWFYPSEKSNEEFNSEDELRKFLIQ